MHYAVSQVILLNRRQEKLVSVTKPLKSLDNDRIWKPSCCLMRFFNGRAYFFTLNFESIFFAFNALTLFVGRQEGHLSFITQLVPSVLWRCWLGCRKGIRPVKMSDGVLAWLSVWSEMQTCIWPVSCFSKIQIGFTFLVPAHPGSPGKMAVKRVCVFLFVFRIDFQN